MFRNLIVSIIFCGFLAGVFVFLTLAAKTGLDSCDLCPVESCEACLERCS